MTHDLSRVCDLIAQPAGTELLYLLRDIYFDRPWSEHAGSNELVAMARGASLVTGGSGAARLTPLGYLVGNVAKEYCNWLDAGRTIPEQIPPAELFDGKDVLDIGCSFGRFLWEFQRSARSVTGIELQEAFAVLGAALAKQEGIAPPRIVVGSADALPDHFSGASFDFVFSRLVLTHVSLRTALPQLMAVLRPGGRFWIQVESYRVGLGNLATALRARNVRGSTFAALGVANTALFSTVGRQVSIRSSGRMHSKHQPVYPTAAAWRRALLAAGAGRCQADYHGPYSLVVTGTR
jgi:SAM-dependent methyltransferase